MIAYLFGIAFVAAPPPFFCILSNFWNLIFLAVFQIATLYFLFVFCYKNEMTKLNKTVNVINSLPVTF